MLENLERDGYAIMSGVFALEEVEALIAQLPDLAERAGTRTLLALDWGRRLANDPRMVSLAQEVVGPSARPVRGILFDKSASANWNLDWHQDTKIAVRERRDAPGYQSWSEKEGVVHCKPPVAVHEASIALRLSLDDCGPDNGPLRVLPGSHLDGYWNETSPIDTSKEVACTCKAGDVVLMRPLLLHASSRSVSVAHRRVVHIEYCGVELAPGLEWAFC